MSGTSVRIGIDVGGTFTHAVAVDNETLKVMRKTCFPTTHGAADGVAEGIWKCLEELISSGSFKADDVVFVAHSTTQATNALLEGDVSPVDIIGIVEGASGIQAKRELSFNKVEISGDRSIPVRPFFIKPAQIEEQLQALLNERPEGGEIRTFAVAEAFSVDDPEREIQAVEFLTNAGCTATSGHEVSGLYGLKARARTSVVNAAILPKMMDVAEKTRIAVEKLSIKPALMIMRSDGGVMSAALMKKTPILTILSGPAAGVSAAILYEKIANGLFVEIGGTSTDVSLLIDGKPQKKQAVIGGNILYLKTLDVRTVGAAGGSMIRISGKRISDVGPRSAHIAGLNYSCFSDPATWKNPTVRLIAPLKGDPEEYAVIDTGSGELLAPTTTCAANFLNKLPENDYASGNKEAAALAFRLIGEKLDCSAEDAALSVLKAASAKIEKVCLDLIKDYSVSPAGLTVIGGGGGASVIAPVAAENLKIPYRIAQNPEVISAIGAAMAMMKNVVEKSMVDPSETDLKELRAQASASLVSAGCDPDTIEVEIEVDRRKNIARASAVGSYALVSDRRHEKIEPSEAMEIAVRNVGDSTMKTEIAFEDSGCCVIQGTIEKKGFLGIGHKVTTPAVVVDSHGLARLTLHNADIFTADRADFMDVLQNAVSAATIYSDGGTIAPAVYIVFGGRVSDLSNLGDAEKILNFASIEIAEHSSFSSFCIIIKK